MLAEEPSARHRLAKSQRLELEFHLQDAVTIGGEQFPRRDAVGRDRLVNE